SLILQDLDGGLVSAVSYDSHDPVERTLKSFAVDLTGEPDQAKLLEQARGEKVEAVLNQTSNQPAGTLTGTIVGVETHKEVHGDKAVVDAAYLNLWGPDGLRSVKLADCQRVRFLNPVLEGEYRRALDTLALSHDAQKKAVSLQFNGKGRRNVRVGYVTESPVWKTSYRLSLPPKGDTKPQLQGWAVVENPTDEDWSNVRMALVSGRPISFKMDLYQPLYAPRPTVEPELFASLRPQAYEGNMAGETKTPAESPPALRKPAAAARGLASFQNGSPSADRAGAAGRSELFGADRKDGEKLGDVVQLDLAAGVASAASAQRLGESFQYRLEQPVNLPRQKSALLPIVQHEVEASRVSVYNPAVHAKYPLLGLKLKNSTGLNLMQGPITVFDSGVYAGDARILDLQPNDERLLTYAVDLGTEVETKSKNPPSRITAVKLQKGILYSTSKHREEKTYHAVNRSPDDKTLLVEHPYRPEFKLANDVKPAERTRDQYRFELKLAKGQPADITVAEERDIVQTVALTNSDTQQMRFFLQQQVLSKPVREALEKANGLRNDLATTQRELQQAVRSLQQIETDQGRLRENLKATPPTAAAYKRYLEKLDKQEVELEKLQGQRDQLQAKEHDQRTAFETYLSSLNVE
ncbi:MAG TPA: DUF4139 domain-containing protein, partial [Gemmataceae bacterium]|nr:DUF4139 domain-containing protein [Gemmataceae bacterium]